MSDPLHRVYEILDKHVESGRPQMVSQLDMMWALNTIIKMREELFNALPTKEANYIMEKIGDGKQ